MDPWLECECCRTGRECADPFSKFELEPWLVPDELWVPRRGGGE